MRKVSRIWRDYRDSGALHTLVPIRAAVDDRTFVTKSGQVVTFVAAEGVDADCLDPAATEAVVNRFAAAARNLDERFHVHQYFSKRTHPEIPTGQYTNAVVQQSIEARSAYLNSRADRLYSLDTHFAIALSAWPEKASWRARFARIASDPKTATRRAVSTEATIGQLEADLSRASTVSREKIDSLVRQLQDVLPLRVLDTQAGYHFLRRLLNYDQAKADVCPLKHNGFVDFFATDSALEAHRGHLRLDDYVVHVLSLKEPPTNTFAHMLRALQTVRANFIIATEWKREPNASMRRLILSMRRHFHNSKASLLNYMVSTSPTSAPDRLIDDGAVSVIGDLGSCLEELEMNGRYFGQFSMTVVIYDEDRTAVQRATAECVKVFSTFGAHLVQESYNALNAWLAVLPGNHAYNLRRLYLSDANYADLSFAFGQRPGEAVNAHLAAEHLITLETEAGTPYFLNLHCGDNAHSLVLGATGSGKSFLLNVLLTALQKYGTLTFIFDLGGSYKSLTELFGGAYLAVGRDTGKFSINPFCLPATPENLHFLRFFCRGLIESGGYAMSTADERDLAEQIENLYTLDPEQRRLSTLASVLNRTLRAELHQWTQGGPYGSWFDNVTDTVTLSPFQAFDFEGLDAFPDVLELLVFYILHRANASIYDPALVTRFKVFVIDEAWRFFRHPAIRTYITEALKTWRKKNAAMILATQSLEDLRQSELLPVIVESCVTKFFLANPGADRELYREVFHLNQTEADRIATLIPKQQILLKQGDLGKVVSLNVDPKAYWLYTTNPAESAKRRDVFARHGLKNGLEILTRSSS